MECIDKLLIDDLREAVILYNTPQTDDLMQAKDARVHASLHNNVPVLAATGRDASGPGLSRRSRGGDVKEPTVEGKERGVNEGGRELGKGSMEVEAVDGQMEGDGGDQLLLGLKDHSKGLLGNLRKTFREIAKNNTNVVSKTDGAIGKERNGGVDGRLDSAWHHLFHNVSKRLHMQRKLQSATDDHNDEMPHMEAKTFYNNFMFNLKGQDPNSVNHSDPENFKVKKRMLLDTLYSNVSSHDLLFQNEFKNRQENQLNEEFIDSNDVFDKYNTMRKSNTRTLMVLGGRFQHKRSKEKFDIRGLPNATLGPIDKSDRALAFRIGDNRLDVIKSYVDKDHKDPSLQNYNSKFDQSSNYLPRPVDVRKSSSLPQNSPTSHPSLPVQSKVKNLPHGSKSQLSKSGRLSKRKLDDLLERGLPTAKPDNELLLKKTKMLRDSQEDVLAKGPLQFLPAILLLQIIENDKLRESVTVNRFQDSEVSLYYVFVSL